MSYDFIPMTEEEINRAGLVDDGVYDFNIVNCERKVSKANNPMAKLTIEFWDKEGRVHTIYDYLVFSKIGLNIRKVKHFCDAVGLQDKYLLGQVPEELDGYSGKARIVIQIGKEIEHKDLNGKPAGSKYPDRNIVDDYITYDVKSYALQPLKDSKPLPLDDIPF
jgi:hypothetical protein